MSAILLLLAHASASSQMIQMLPYPREISETKTSVVMLQNQLQIIAVPPLLGLLIPPTTPLLTTLCSPRFQRQQYPGQSHPQILWESGGTYRHLH